MKKTLILAATALISLNTEVWACSSHGSHEKASHYKSYVGTSSKQTAEVHIFRDVDDAIACMKEFLKEEKKVALATYKWTRKGQEPTNKYELIVSHN